MIRLETTKKNEQTRTGTMTLLGKSILLNLGVTNHYAKCKKMMFLSKPTHLALIEYIRRGNKIHCHTTYTVPVLTGKFANCAPEIWKVYYKI